MSHRSFISIFLSIDVVSPFLRMTSYMSQKKIGAKEKRKREAEPVKRKATTWRDGDAHVVSVNRRKKRDGQREREREKHSLWIVWLLEWKKKPFNIIIMMHNDQTQSIKLWRVKLKSKWSLFTKSEDGEEGQGDVKLLRVSTLKKSFPVFLSKSLKRNELILDVDCHVFVRVFFLFLPHVNSNDDYNYTFMLVDVLFFLFSRLKNIILTDILATTLYQWQQISFLESWCSWKGAILIKHRSELEDTSSNPMDD